MSLQVVLRVNVNTMSEQIIQTEQNAMEGANSGDKPGLQNAHTASSSLFQGAFIYCVFLMFVHLGGLAERTASGEAFLLAEFGFHLENKFLFPFFLPLRPTRLRKKAWVWREGWGKCA